ncbi:hypothetical protein OESDEN_02559 [Oesophagostomum dentatum]|uniref:Uncharacterized protein n=1 Tax=Oesophagostomum dentatum TaxID=61180 RepID=A0A0B1TIS3_OESDE|nr:hypothetical protein OESDEN_02559 [Oesophagostomum dentatum]
MKNRVYLVEGKFVPKYAPCEQITGVSYESLQELSKKASADTVKDMWIRQLMVCPGMSSDRAQKVANRFPSMAAMMLQYSEVSDAEADCLLNLVVPEINRRVSAQLRKFFNSAIPASHRS